MLDQHRARLIMDVMADDQEVICGSGLPRDRGVEDVDGVLDEGWRVVEVVLGVEVLGVLVGGEEGRGGWRREEVRNR